MLLHKACIRLLVMTRPITPPKVQYIIGVLKGPAFASVKDGRLTVVCKDGRLALMRARDAPMTGIYTLGF